jgi:hypothetical protein
VTDDVSNNMNVYCLFDSLGERGKVLLGIWLTERDAKAHITRIKKLFGQKANDLTIEKWPLIGTEEL